MKLKVLIKLSSLLFILSCAEAGPATSLTAQNKTTSVTTQDSSLYASYDCTAFPRYDWVDDTKKNKAFLKMAITKIHELNIWGHYLGQDSAKSQCKVTIYTNTDQLNIKTHKQAQIKLDIKKDYKIQGFSCTNSRVRYDLTYENPTYGTTEYLSLAFSPNAQVLKEIFFDTHSLGPNSSRFECGTLRPLSI